MVSTKFLLANLALTTAVLGAVCPGVPPVNAVGTAASVNVAAALPTSTKHNPYRPRPSTKSQPNTNARPNTKAASAAAKPTSKASAKPTSVNPTSVKPTTKASVKPTTAAAAKPTSTAKASTAAAPAPSAAAAGSLASNPINKVELGAKWEICIHAPIKHDSVDDIIPKDAKILDIDMVHAQEFPNMIPMIKKAGKAVICYFNAGAVQVWDDDKGAFPASVTGTSLGGPYTGDSNGEWYIDVRSQTVVDIMKKRLDLAAKIGCDGVDPDNIDAWVSDGEDRTGFNLKPEDYVNYLTKLADYAHSIKTTSGAPLLIGQKNAGSIAPALVSVLDFAVLESCRDWGFCGDFQRYISANKPVFSIQYPLSIPEQGKLNAADQKLYCDEPTSKHGDTKFSNILKYASAQLDGWGQECGEASYQMPYAAYN